MFQPLRPVETRCTKFVTPTTILYLRREHVRQLFARNHLGSQEIVKRYFDVLYDYVDLLTLIYCTVIIAVCRVSCLLLMNKRTV